MRRRCIRLINYADAVNQSIGLNTRIIILFTLQIIRLQYANCSKYTSDVLNLQYTYTGNGINICSIYIYTCSSSFNRLKIIYLLYFQFASLDFECRTKREENILIIYILFEHPVKVYIYMQYIISERKINSKKNFQTPFTSCLFLQKRSTQFHEYLRNNGYAC